MLLMTLCDGGDANIDVALLVEATKVLPSGYLYHPSPWSIDQGLA